MLCVALLPTVCDSTFDGSMIKGGLMLFGVAAMARLSGFRVAGFRWRVEVDLKNGPTAPCISVMA